MSYSDPISKPVRAPFNSEVTLRDLNVLRCETLVAYGVEPEAFLMNAEDLQQLSDNISLPHHGYIEQLWGIPIRIKIGPGADIVLPRNAWLAQLARKVR